MKKVMKSFLFLITIFSVLLISDTQIKAEDYDEIKVDYVKSYSAMDTASSVYSKDMVVTQKSTQYAYAKFTLENDSYVKIMRSRGNVEGDGWIRGSLNVYSNEAMTSEKMCIDEYEEEKIGFLTAGTYYVKLRYENIRGGDTVFNTKVTIAAVTCNDLLMVSSTADQSKTKSTVTVTQTLGEKLFDLQYYAGKVSESDVNNSKYWARYNSFYNKYDSSNAVILPNEDTTTFTVKKNGTYTIRIKDLEGNVYSKTFLVKGVDDKAPIVTGVKNKKTHKKTVTIKFKDEQGGSGIKKATLNNKKIKSGKKVSKNGSYILKATDKAGNTRTIQFKIKK